MTNHFQCSNEETKAQKDWLVLQGKEGTKWQILNSEYKSSSEEKEWTAKDPESLKHEEFGNWRYFS